LELGEGIDKTLGRKSQAQPGLRNSFLVGEVLERYGSMAKDAGMRSRRDRIR
jgi:hypothetical protein